ncbi:putative peroxin 14 17 [Rosellinia necatrix]|uniref:Peroxisomal membrane protein PEX14 n=1 Tax=Rosellinia necatrix TaxID=77044 RepID=A0A1W2TP34_ROSNE|nr:putative peroxin 14 17 [Rosellinia necatrix]
MEDSKESSIPARQQASADGASEPGDVTLDHARAFLNDENVKAAPPKQKHAFLKSKGLDDSQITRLLDESPEESRPPVSQPTTESSAAPDDMDQKTGSKPDIKRAPSPPPGGSSSVGSSTPGAPSPTVTAPYPVDSPAPIITYPEFLTKPQRPPPIITPSRLANIVAVSGGVWALAYGIAGLFIRPMVDNLNGARSEYYDHVNRKLSQLVEKLEDNVSEVPYKTGKALKPQYQDRAIDDNASVDSDPTELFHRDVGTQTSPPPSVLGSAPNVDGNNNNKSGSEKPIDAQLKTILAINALTRELALMHTQRAESNADLRSAIGELRDQVDKMAYPAVHDFSSYGGYIYGQGVEVDDEFKKTKDAIRSVKGLFLSSRSFPAVATR